MQVQTSTHTCCGFCSSNLFTRCSQNALACCAFFLLLTSDRSAVSLKNNDYLLLLSNGYLGPCIKSILTISIPRTLLAPWWNLHAKQFLIMTHTVGIVGAGLAGLTCAHYLNKTLVCQLVHF